MLRWLPIVLALVACRIPGDHFIPIGGDDTMDDGGNGDGSGSGSADAPVAAGRGYFVEGALGIYRFNKTQSGALSVASPTPTNVAEPRSAVVNQLGTKLYVATGTAAASSMALEMTINPTDGTLTAGASDPFGGCLPQSMAWHPSGEWIAVGCASNSVGIVRLNTNGAITSAQSYTHGVAPMAAAFSFDGTCLFLADGSSNNNKTQALAFDAISGTPQLSNSSMFPNGARAIATHPTLRIVYVAGSGSTGLQTFSYIGTCMISQLGSGLMTGSSTTGMVISPDGQFMYVVGAGGVYVYSINSSGVPTMLPNSPQLTGTGLIEAVAMDPALPNTLYLTKTGGVTQVTIGAGQTLTASAEVTAGNGSGRWFALGR